MIRRMFVGRSPSRGRDADKPAWPQNNSRPNDRQASRSSRKIGARPVVSVTLTEFARRANSVNVTETTGLAPILSG